MSSDADAAKLRALAAARLTALLAQVGDADTAIPSEHLEELRRLAVLIELADKLQPPQRRKRWPMAAALVLTLAIVSVLIFLRVPRTEIELEATVTEFAFRVPVELVLTEVAQLRYLGTAGAEVVGVDDRPGDTLALVTDIEDCAGTITLDRIVLPRGAYVWLRRTSRPERLHLTLNAAGATLRATLDRCVRVGGANTSAGVRTITLKLGEEDVDLDLEPVAGDIEFAPVVRAGDLTLARVEQTSRGQNTLVRRVSTLVAGRLYYPSLGGEERKLRFAEPIRFRHSDGEIRSIEFGHDTIMLRFHGEVSGMAIGASDDARSLMPTFLEWVRANHSLELLWGSALYLFGLLVALAKWWRPGG